MYRVAILLALFLLGVAGCGTDTPPSSPRKATAEPEPELTPVTANGWATLEGRVVLQGDVPALKEIEIRGPDRGHCPERFADPTWKVDASKGVAGVVVYVKPPKGQYLPTQPPDRQSWPKEVVVRQPHCQFEPRITVTMPQVYDDKSRRLVGSGQTFKIVNDADMPHAAALEGNAGRNAKIVSPVLRPLVPGGRPDEFVVRGLQAQAGPLVLTCPLHSWMRGYVFAFGHPYATVTGADGRYRIENVPAGAAVDLAAWHESGLAVQPEGLVHEVALPAGGVLKLDWHLGG